MSQEDLKCGLFYEVTCYKTHVNERTKTIVSSPDYKSIKNYFSSKRFTVLKIEKVIPSELDKVVLI